MGSTGPDRTFSNTGLFSFLAVHFRYFMTTPADVGLSDIVIQTWLDDNLNSQILGFFAYGQAPKVSNSIFKHVLTI